MNRRRIRPEFDATTANRDFAVLRRGAATLDYVLALGVVLPLLTVILPLGRRMMQLVYEMTTTLIAWPFM
ncbi:MAG: hypothetical protein KDA75_15010 [Planctomycetaceae bacterium]|nr:hypothetical protein [Planctomycetaceae bacterium]